MSEEKKVDEIESVEDLLEKTLELLAPKITHDNTPTCSLIQPKPRKKFKWRKTIELEKANEDVMPNPLGFLRGAECVHGCGAAFSIMSYAVTGTFGVDRDLRAGAVAQGWTVVTRLSGHLEYACPGCLLKAA